MIFYAANYLKRRFVDVPDADHARRMGLACPVQLFKSGASCVRVSNLKLILTS